MFSIFVLLIELLSNYKFLPAEQKTALQTRRNDKREKQNR